MNFFLSWSDLGKLRFRSDVCKYNMHLKTISSYFGVHGCPEFWVSDWSDACVTAGSLHAYSSFECSNVHI